jgi:hypothetical protein
MSRSNFIRSPIAPAILVGLCPFFPAWGADGLQVISYNSGTNRFQFSAYTNPQVALGMPQTDPDGVTTPFNNPFSKNDDVSVGLGGELTLQLSNEVLVTPGAPEIGVFTFQQFVEESGGTDSGPTLFYPSILAEVDVSADGNNWVSLNGGVPIAFNIPANAYQNTAATIPSNYFQPFTGTLASMANQPNLASLLTVYGSSAGGNWLDISGTGLSDVDFIRFTVPSTDTFSFQLDAVTVSTAATGSAVPEPAALAILTLSGGLFLRRKH